MQLVSKFRLFVEGWVYNIMFLDRHAMRHSIQYLVYNYISRLLCLIYELLLCIICSTSSIYLNLTWRALLAGSGRNKKSYQNPILLYKNVRFIIYMNKNRNNCDIASFAQIIITNIVLAATRDNSLTWLISSTQCHIVNKVHIIYICKYSDVIGAW